MNSRRRKRQPPEPFEASIEGLSHEGRGICHHNGKIVFVFAALPGERVRVQINRQSKQYADGSVIDVLEASPMRIDPLCPHFSVCGGCSLQHIDADDQIRLKQQALMDMLQHARIPVGQLIPPLRGPAWGYRRKARLGVKYVHKKQRLLIGFRERSKPYLADMQQCHILVEQVGLHLQSLIDLVSGLDARETIAQIELAADDDHTVLVLRHLKPLSDNDRPALEQFARQSGLWIQLQPQGPDSIHALYPAQQQLQFRPLANDDIRIQFSASDFVQVNNHINQQMVQQALDLLALKPTDRVLDLFCGLGNFTLPIAARTASVTGIEGSEAMVQRARLSALDNDIVNTEYWQANLDAPNGVSTWLRQQYDAVVLDPPRSGALEIVKLLGRTGAAKIVYVSCQPASFVRDAQALLDQGYRLSQLGLMDMFPQTAHVETMGLFVRGDH